MANLANKTLVITGASRGIGLAIALRAARDGANIVILAKTAEPNPNLPGTIFTAAKEIEAAGGKALPLAVDVRDDAQVDAAVAAAVERFGGIDILVNNASAMFRQPTLDTDMKRFDLLFDINVRGTFQITRKCLPHLLMADNPQVLTIAPLPVLDHPEKFAPFPAYMISKFNMSLFTMAWAEEFRGKVGFNALWPRLAIWTAASRAIRGDAHAPRARSPEIMADAAWHVLTQNAKSFTGRFLLDDDVLRDAGVTDFTPYYHVDADPADMNASIWVSHGLLSVEESVRRMSGWQPD